MKIAEPRKTEPIKLVKTATGEPRYRVVLDAAPMGSGARKQIRKTFLTLTEARAYVAEHKSDRRRGTLVTAKRQTFETYANGWLDGRSRRVREVTLRSYQGCLGRAVAAFGDKQLSAVTRADIEALVSGLERAGRSKRTASLTLFVLRSVFVQALDDGLIARSPANRVKAAGREPVQRTALSAVQLGLIANHLRNSADPLLSCWLLTLAGLRRSEVLGLRWSDLDLTAATVRIERGRVLLDGKHTEEGAPKTRRGARTVHLSAPMVEALRGMREHQAAALGFDQVRAGYLAVDAAGRPMRPERWSDLWREHCTAAGVPALTLHAARHSSVTAMRNAGVPDHIVAAHHGHDEYVMRAVYSHPDDVGLASAAQALSDAMTGAAS